MRGIVICCMLGVASADLRQAAWPKRGYKLRQDNGGRGGENFVAATSQTTTGQQKSGGAKGVVMFAEPAAFSYQGLKNQRQNNYDNFLRSNIDNEQDNRNFNNERGLDMQPFRTCESSAPTTYPYGDGPNNRCDGSLQNVNGGNEMNPLLTATPGEPRMTPLRWNNPHASEIEVNLWIMCSDPPTIVPVKKPTCSGEGNQNNILQWAIPADFNQMNWQSCASTACFNGCNAPGDCMLQVYAHSVETRQYSSATPIVITGGTFQGQKLQYNAIPEDDAEKNAYEFPKSFDLEAMILGVKPGDPSKQGKRLQTGQARSNTGGGDPATTLKVCASSERNGISSNGDIVYQVELSESTTTFAQLNSPKVSLFICKRTDQEVQAEQEVESVKFVVTTSADGTATYANPLERTENYSPFEFFSEDDFGGEGVKKVTATIKLYSGTDITKTVYLDLRGAARRWRFRRHLQTGCPSGKLTEPAADVRLNLAALKREVCLSATDPNANYDRTTLQRAVLHSDVANHAYQNSDYSPYMGQQANEISRTLQAASIVHMTSGNRGELGKNMIPNRVKNLVNQLNNKVNNIYQNYEKVVNKIIDDLGNGAKNGGNAQVGAQALGNAFRSVEKGSTSTKRLKTTTYVPSFEVTRANYNMNTINRAIQKRTGGNKNAYKDTLTSVNQRTGRQYVLIYQPTLEKMLPDFQKAAEYGVTYQGSITRTPCSAIENQDLLQLSNYQGNNAQAAEACCVGSLQNTGPNGCGATKTSANGHRKRNANGKKDGGLYSAKSFMLQHMRSLYNCPADCIERTSDSNDNLAQALTKTSKGTCITSLAVGNNGQTECVASDIVAATATDCRGCQGIYNNADPGLEKNGWDNGGKLPGVADSVQLPRSVSNTARLMTMPEPEPEANVVRADGFADLIPDDTAICHSESKYSCGDLDKKEFITAEEAAELEEKCTETESTKIDTMCQDSPCDANPDSEKCRLAYSSCKYDPESQVMCDPRSDNDPCQNCVCATKKGCSDPKYSQLTVDSGNSAFLALTSAIVLAAVL